MKTLAALVMGLALLGLALSLVLLVGGYFGLDARLTSLGVVVFVGFFVVAFPSFFIIKNATQDLPQREVTNLMYAGCPAWLKRLGYVVMAFGALNFFGSILLQKSGSRAAQSDWFPAIALGGFGLMAYSAFFNQLYSSVHLPGALNRLRCPNGHAVRSDAKFCDRCGAPVLTTGSWSGAG